MKRENRKKWVISLLGFIVMLMGANAFVSGDLMFIPLFVGGAITTALMLQEIENTYKTK